MIPAADINEGLADKKAKDKKDKDGEEDVGEKGKGIPKAEKKENDKEDADNADGEESEKVNLKNQGEVAPCILADSNEASPTEQTLPGSADDESGEAEDKDKKPAKKDDKKSDGKKSDKEKEPVRERVLLNPKSHYLKGKPLGTIFPFLESDTIKNLPIQNLEFTYNEKEENFLSPPGLRLEVDVLFKDKLQWASDGLRKIFGQKAPSTLHLSAHLSDKRDWSKRPKIEKLVLQGYFKDMKLKPWDFLEFQTLGPELTATKVEKKKSKDDKEKSKEEADDKEKEEADDKEKEKEERKADDDKQEFTADKGGQEDGNANAEKTEEEPAKKDEEGPAPSDEIGSAETPKDDAQVDDDSEKKQQRKVNEDEEGSAQVQSDKKPAGKKDTKKDSKGETDEDKSKSKSEWKYGFGFFGSLNIIGIPHAKALLNLSYRIARDVVVEKDDKKKEKGGDGAKEKKKKDATDASKEKTGAETEKKDEKNADEEKVGEEAVDRSSGSGKQQKKDLKKKPEKDAKTPKVQRLWNLVIVSDKWKDIYGIENVSVSHPRVALFRPLSNSAGTS